MKRILLFILVVCPFFNMNAQLQLDWVKSIGGPSDDRPNNIALDASGNIFIVGQFQGTVDFDPSSGVFNATSNGGNDAFVLKLDSTGNFRWVKTFGGSGEDYVASVKIADNGDPYIVGGFQSTVDFDPSSGSVNNSSSLGGYDMYILRLDVNGLYQFHKVIGGTGNDYVTDIAIDYGLNQFAITGRVESIVDLDPSSAILNYDSGSSGDFFISKFDSNGNLIWANAYPNAGLINSIGRELAFDSNNNVFLTGQFAGTTDFDLGTGSATYVPQNVSRGIFVLKLDSNGNFIFVKIADKTSPAVQNLNLTAWDLIIDSNNDVIITGIFRGSIIMNAGEGGSSILLNGSTSVFSPFIWKISNSGNYIWAKSFTSGVDSNINSVVVDYNNDVYVAGNYSSQIDVGGTLLSSGGNLDAYLVKMDAATGNTSWSYSFAGSYSEDITELKFNGNKLYVIGTFNGLFDADPGVGTTNLTSNGSNDLFIMEFTETSLGTEDFTTSNFKIYPNPASNSLHIETFLATSFKYDILSLDGKVMQSGMSQLNDNEIDISKLALGFYLIDIQSENNQRSVYKFIKN